MWGESWILGDLDVMILPFLPTQMGDRKDRLPGVCLMFRLPKKQTSFGGEPIIRVTKQFLCWEGCLGKWNTHTV